MAVVNPFADDPERGAAWEQGYDAGFAEPETEHLPPLESELLDVFSQGEQAGRDDRRNEPTSQDPVPSSESSDFSRFEVAPEGTLIPIPDEAPEGNPIRDDAQIAVNPRTSAGYYVAIYNGATDSQSLIEEAQHLLSEVLFEAKIVTLERLLAAAVREGAHGIVRYGGLFVSVAISVLTPSPVLRESRFRGYLDDGTAIAYVILDPQS